MVTVLPRIQEAEQPVAATSPMSAAAWLILAYVVITRIGNLEAAKLGGHIGGIPIFLTEIFMMASFAATIMTRPIPLLVWVLSGSWASPIGRVVWLIAILATVEFALAFSQYGVYAARDFAIYMYSLFFVLTYFAISRREHAVRLLLWATYAGVVAAFLLIFTTVTNIHFGLFGEGERYVLGESFETVGGGDVGGIIAFSMASLGAYLLIDKRRRYFNAVCVLVCFAGIALPQTRSAIFGLALAATYSTLTLGARHRVILCCMGLLAVGLVAASPLLPDYLPGATALQNLYAAVVSGAEYHADGNAQFRLIRWHLALETWLKSPVFGVGFGTNILPNWLISIDELNTFNYGMPHNTYLTILARTGVIGLTLFVFPIVWVLYRAHRLIRTGWGDVHLLAAANMICAMVGFGLFVLFFERPMHGATFWVMMAVMVRLMEFTIGNAATGPVSDMSAGDAPLTVPAMPGPPDPAE